MFQSDEPGYYEDDVFGIRLETDLEVVEANTTVIIILKHFNLIFSTSYAFFV